jgi:thiol:disulfide interchange protein DsbD
MSRQFNVYQWMTRDSLPSNAIDRKLEIIQLQDAEVNVGFKSLVFLLLNWLFMTYSKSIFQVFLAVLALVFALHTDHSFAASPNNDAPFNDAFSNDFSKKSLLDNNKQDVGKSDILNENKTTTSTSKFIPADQAFKLVGEAKDNKLKLDFQVTHGYYLYQKKFVYYSNNSTVKFQEAIFSQPAQIKDDPEFGKVPVYHDDVSITVPYSGSGKVMVRWQGCADAGLCYPPQNREFNLPASTVASSNNSANASVTDPNTASITAIQASNLNSKPDPVIPIVDGRPDIRTNIEKSAGVQSILLPLPMPNDRYSYGLPLAPIKQKLRANQATDDDDSDHSINIDGSAVNFGLVSNLPNSMTLQPTLSVVPASEPTVQKNLDPFGLAQHPLTAFLLLFFAGLGLVFTPCVLPMLPIVANLVARQHRRSMAHGLLLSGSYAIGVASCYAVLGAVIAVFGQQFNLLGWLQNPVILVLFAIIFVLLALANFDVYTLGLPQGLQTKIDAYGQREGRVAWLKQGSVVGSWFTGFVSALVISPCVSAPLAGVLLSVSTIGNPFLGAAALFMLGLGLGAPLMILGATEGRFLPKAGNWLHWVREGFGLLLLGVALILLNRAFDNSYILLLWAALSMACALWFWRWLGRGRFVTQVFALVVGAWGVMQIVGVAAGQTDPWHPLAGINQQQVAAQTTPVIHSLAELDVWKEEHPQLLVDITADWCVSCRIMERELFSGQDIKGLSGWTRVKLDVTDSNENSKAVLKKLNLFGPPALIFDKQGREVGRIVGETDAKELAQTLAQL